MRFCDSGLELCLKSPVEDTHSGMRTGFWLLVETRLPQWTHGQNVFLIVLTSLRTIPRRYVVGPDSFESQLILNVGEDVYHPRFSRSSFLLTSASLGFQNLRFHDLVNPSHGAWRADICGFFLCSQGQRFLPQEGKLLYPATSVEASACLGVLTVAHKHVISQVETLYLHLEQVSLSKSHPTNASGRTAIASRNWYKIHRIYKK